MKTPLIVVTGPIASGKTTVAEEMARGGGVRVDADELAHEALKDPALARDLVEEFGGGISAVDGGVSRTALAEIVFRDGERLRRLDGMMRPYVRRLVEERLSELDGSARYIVLDAVLFLQYKFDFEADLVVMTFAPEEVRIRRMMSRNGMDRGEAELRIERQRDLFAEWEKADVRIDTDRPLDAVKGEAARIRDGFLEELERSRRTR